MKKIPCNNEILNKKLTPHNLSKPLPKESVKKSPLQRGGSEADGVFLTYKKLPYNPALKDRAKALRKAGNLSE
ncbi:MAG: hypothetical protein R6U84_07720, partial [Candidatus Cloacimonadales bacterium]